ncbi:transposase [uncultured Arthrobacter sp.]|uniref:transposase n=1 Tax=uncultured Arthrobacter sp. TaxID=114050 RepID=UPI00262F43DB|nr:transposase [uncultured Arthrobacter sp.]
MRAAYRHPNAVEGHTIAGKILDSLPTCTVPEIARLGRTLKRWSNALLAYFDTNRSNNGGTEAVKRLIELHRRVPSRIQEQRHVPPTHAPHRRRTHPPPPHVRRASKSSSTGRYSIEEAGSPLATSIQEPGLNGYLLLVIVG